MSKVMATIKCFEDIESWKKARTVCKKLGVLIEEGRLKKSYRLINQIEGSSGSIMDNIAEGFERGTRAEFIQFLGYAKGSCGELRSQLYRTFDRNYIIQQEFEDLKASSMQISGLIQNLINYLQKSEIAGVRKKNTA
ncbi:MAG TPA: four helix bundle protein [Chitinophagaceae bacterium]|nr:four helix bundle protein [Chitinophagaceae bacterium]